MISCAMGLSVMASLLSGLDEMVDECYVDGMIVAAVVGGAHEGEDSGGAERLEGALGEMEHLGYIVGVEEEVVLVDGRFLVLGTGWGEAFSDFVFYCIHVLLFYGL